MATSLDLISGREKGEAPVSIGTSLALESLGGFGEFPNDKPPIHDFDEIWVNIRTLFRNALGALESDARREVSPDDMILAVTDDMRVLESTIELKSSGKMRVVFYACGFRSFKQEFPNAKWKEPTTDKQRVEHQLEQNTLELLATDQHMPQGLTVHLFDVRFTERGKNAVILTHYPCDLLWRSNFQQLTLLESHTGRLKTQAEWYTKLTSGKRYDRIPFNRLTMQVMGDGNLLFASMSRKFKERLVELADRFRWTPMTTDERVRFSIRELDDQEERDFFLGLLKR